jgi:predicted AlkP superfamily phosphohydrolase/phosphomutase
MPHTFSNCILTSVTLLALFFKMIYMNLKGREPNGVIAREDYAAVRGRIIAAWRNLKDENGKPVAAAVFTSEEAQALPAGRTTASISHPDKTGDAIIF